MKKLLTGLTAVIILAVLPALLAACGGSTPTADPNLTAAPGDTISVNYVGTLEDGTQFDSSYDRNQVLTFVVGAGQMITGFDAAVRGMKVGEKKTATLAPEEAYGQHLDSRIITLDRSTFPADATLTVGQQVPLTNSSGQQMIGIITAIQPGAVTIDLNHELAGKTLIFEIEMVSITRPAG